MSTITAKVDFSPYMQKELPLKNINGTNIQVDWGDGSQIETFTDGTGNATHTYTNNDAHDYKYEIVVTGNITGLGDNAFHSGYYTEVNLPEGITTIGDACFRGSKIEYLIIPKTVTSIGNQFNYDNAVLKELDIKGNSLITIGTDFCFRTTQLRTLKLPDSITNIGVRALSVCSSLKELTVPKNLTGFSLFFLQNAMLDTIIFKNGPINRPPITESTKIIVPLSKLQEFINHSSYPNERERYDVFGKNLSEKVYVLGVHLAENLQDKNIVASADDGLTTLANKIDDIYENIPRVIIEDDTVTDFADLRFTVIVPKNCTYIVGYCFRYCQNLKYCILPEGITTIGIAAFEYCDNLKELILPSTVTTLNPGAMRNIPNLEKLKFKSIIPPTSSSTATFKDLPTTCIIEVPNDSLSAYESAQYYPDPNTYTYVGY